MNQSVQKRECIFLHWNEAAPSLAADVSSSELLLPYPLSVAVLLTQLWHRFSSETTNLQISLVWPTGQNNLFPLVEVFLLYIFSS